MLLMLGNLGDSLKSTLKKIAGSIFIDEKLIDEIVREIQRALLQADVNVKLVFELSKNIKKRALDEKAPKNLDQREYIINVVYEELVKFLGENRKEIKIEKKKPFKIMLLGLFGSGKTTTSAKLAKYYSKRGYKVGILGLDVWRAAALKQLKQLGEKININVYGNEKEKNPIKIYKEFEKEYKDYDLLIIDTAGRDALNDELIKEIDSINKMVNPDEVLLVISADIGQAAQSQAQKFHETCKVTGVIATKMDSTAKAGGALSACAATEAPIRFIGMGEKIDDLEEFNPKGFVGRMLGMGDLEALLEKAKEAINEEDAKDMGKKMLKGDFNFLDLYDQLQMMNKMGPLDKIFDMIPGLGGVKLPKEALQVQGDKLKAWKYLFQSMTKEELEDPEILTGDRINRIAKGAGRNASDIRELLKQYRMSKKMMKTMGSGNPEKLMKKFKGKMPMKF